VKRYSFQIQQDYRCLHCHAIVNVNTQFSGVQNRNHCPYCLWSRHLDHFQAGDRLSACKAPMEPIGLTLKITPKKFGSACGELMLIHRCSDCGKLSINRLAADDLNEEIAAVYHRSLSLTQELREEINRAGIHLLCKSDRRTFTSLLYGNIAHPAAYPAAERSEMGGGSGG
jgi:DNA-directed RNA polymerase subunit RPC12/RpoP